MRTLVAHATLCAEMLIAAIARFDCRKRHLDWLRRIDLMSAHERGLPKPALYCMWGDEDEE